MSLKVLALEPWFGGSHRNALEGLASSSSCRFELVALPARFWKWRMQGSAVALAAATRDRVRSGYSPDVVFASSMVNLPAFMALTRSLIPGVPAILYMHENQLTYAVQHDEEPDYTCGFINYLSCLAADAVAFNSEFHRDAFFDALQRLLRRLPDHADPRSVEDIRAKSSVLYLGIDGNALDAPGEENRPDAGSGRPLTILWNHRWEYDKNPAGFFRAIDRLDSEGGDFRLVLLGEDFESRPAVFDEARERYGGRILAFGWEPSCDRYTDWLHRSDVVVSTSHHEFFGLSVLEAIHCGCHPLLPNRLSYPELVGRLEVTRDGCAPILYGSEDALFESLMALARADLRPLPLATLREITAPFDWRVRAPVFDDLFERVVLHS